MQPDSSVFEMIQKINPKILPMDICQTSLDWLEKYVHQWFSLHVPEHGEIWFADENAKGLSSNFPTNDRSVEVILTGSFLLRVLESKLWPFKKCRFWVLSMSIKNILVSTLKLPEDAIGIISRDSCSSNQGHLDFSKPVNFVYAGRLSFSKNVTGLLRLVSCLQTQFNCNVTLDIFGDPDDLHDDSYGRFNPYSMTSLIHSLINELKWITPPTLHGRVEPNKWLSLKRNAPCFVSLSTSMYEDFGVAAEEAKLASWPCLLSNWGGHQECSGAYLIPYNLIPQTREPDFVQQLKATQLASYLLNSKVLATQAKPDQHFAGPRLLNRTEFQSIADNVIQLWGEEILLCLREKMGFFADTAKGMEFFHRYHQGMGKEHSDIAFIVNDLKINSDDTSVTINTAFDVIYTRELFCKYTVLELNRYKAFYLCGLESDLSTVLNFIKNCVGSEIDIKIFPHLSDIKVSV